MEHSEDEELILQMRLDRFILSEGIIGYLHLGGVLLPLEEVMRTLEFPISVDPAEGQANGWFIRENRLFSLDYARGEVVVDGKTIPFDRKLVELHADDIYVDTTLLSKWFPIKFEFFINSLLIKLKATEPLPFQERLEREEKRAHLGRGARLEKFPRQDIPYRLWDWPFIDTSYTLNFDNQTSKFLGGRTSLVSSDLLFMNAELFMAGNNEEPATDLRFKMTRKDPDGNLLGPLHAQEASIGDIFTRQIPLISNSNAGRGAEISSFPLSRPSEFDRTTLRGELPLGWEVELYRNEILLNVQRQPDASGRYEFVDVPLLFGNNILKLVFYGPQGQTREEVSRFFAGSELTRPGQQYYRIAVNQQNRDLFLVGEDEIRDQDGKARYFAEYERGITRRLSVAASLTSLPFEDGRKGFATVGLRSSILEMFTRLDVARDDKGNTAVQVAAQANPFGINIFAEHGQFFDFVSERVEEQADPIKSRSTVRLDGLIPALGILPRIPVSVTGETEARESGRTLTELNNRFSIYSRGITGSNTLNWVLNRGGNLESTTRGNGNFILSGRIERLLLRGALNYLIHPESELSSVTATGDYNFTQDFSTRLTVSHSLTTKTTGLSAGLNRRFKKFALGINANYVDDGSFAAGLNISFGIGKDPRKNRLHVQADRMATTGAASARVFLDKNQNKKFDAGDEPIERARFVGEGDLQTDAEGIALITRLSPHRPNNIVVNERSLEDPFWVLPQPGVEVIPRPGRSALLEFPVIPTGEIDGIVYLRRGEVQKEVSNVVIQLVDSHGELVKEVRSAYDGFYLLGMVIPGRYTLRVSPDQVERLNLLLPPEQEVEIEGAGNVVTGVDIILESAPEKP